MKHVAVYPGTFDPITLGHVDLIHRALRLTHRLILAVSANARKSPLFTLEERLDMARATVADMPLVEVAPFEGLLVDFVQSRDAHVLIRGLRAFSDFEYEFQMALTNRKMAPDVETIFMMPRDIYSYVSSSVVREIASLGGDCGKFVPENVKAALTRKFSHTPGRVEPES